MTFDEARAAYPALGMAVYAMEPGAGVVLEIYTPDGEIYSFPGPTQQAALDLAFPPTVPEPDIFA